MKNWKKKLIGALIIAITPMSCGLGIEGGDAFTEISYDGSLFIGIVLELLFYYLIGLVLGFCLIVYLEDEDEFKTDVLTRESSRKNVLIWTALILAFSIFVAIRFTIYP